MNTFTQFVIEKCLNILQFAITLPPSSLLANLLATVAKTAIDYAIAKDPSTLTDITTQAEQLRVSLKQKSDVLAGAVSHNQPS